MKSLLIKDTTKDERAALVASSLGNCSTCDLCGACGNLDVYEDYIEGRRELRDINTELSEGNSGRVHG